MLVVTRKVGEVIRVGEGSDAIEIMLVKVLDGGKARIGVQANGHLRISRTPCLGGDDAERASDKQPSNQL